MFEVAVVCSDCREESHEMVAEIDDADLAACPCGYSYMILSVAAVEKVYSSSSRLLTSKGGMAQVDGTIEWHDPQGRLHRSNGPARVLPDGRREWFSHGCLHRKGGPAAIYPDGTRVWFHEGRRVREEQRSR